MHGVSRVPSSDSVDALELSPKRLANIANLLAALSSRRWPSPGTYVLAGYLVSS